MSQVSKGQRYAPPPIGASARKAADPLIRQAAQLRQNATVNPGKAAEWIAKAEGLERQASQVAQAEQARQVAADKAQAEPGSVARVSILTAMIAAYAWLLPTVGFILCTIVLLVVLLRLGNVGWAPTIISATGGAAACYLLFTRLGMPLPSGLLGF